MSLAFKACMMIYEKDRSADGLRGVAAASVVVHHFLLAFFPVCMASLFPWAAAKGAPAGMMERIASHPLLITLWNGQLPVCIFFVLSGYVLTRKYFLSGDAENIRSQAARRYLRLGIPVFASVVFAMLVSTWYVIGPAASLTGSVWLTRNAIPGDWWSALAEGTYGAILLGHATTNHVLWTMQVEFIGSMLIFGYALIAGSRHLLMSAVYVALMLTVAKYQWPYFLAFLIGAHIGRMEAPAHKAWLYLAAAMGYLIASIPVSYTGWAYIPVTTSHRLTLVSVLGGALIVYSVRFGALAFLLRSRPVQFLGRISYPLYLIHLPVLLSVACGVFVASIHSGQSRGVSASLALLAFLAVTLPLSWLFERFVDAGAIQLAKWSIQSRVRDPQALAEAP